MRLAGDDDDDDDDDAPSPAPPRERRPGPASLAEKAVKPSSVSGPASERQTGGRRRPRPIQSKGRDATTRMERKIYSLLRSERERERARAGQGEGVGRSAGLTQDVDRLPSLLTGSRGPESRCRQAVQRRAGPNRIAPEANILSTAGHLRHVSAAATEHSRCPAPPARPRPGPRTERRPPSRRRPRPITSPSVPRAHIPVETG
ncbi:hypothetical protein CDD83_7800 [Cordyceps sp. RAO-2017]|nr:hypothetical protein CDD83_7800 [Cordyceps sp. RAO-2017]